LAVRDFTEFANKIVPSFVMLQPLISHYNRLGDAVLLDCGGRTSQINSDKDGPVTCVAMGHGTTS